MRTSKAVEVRSPGKVILVGEHFVVHGGNAVALAIDRYTRLRILSAKKGEIELVFPDKGGKATYGPSTGWEGNVSREVTHPIHQTLDAVFEWCGAKERIKLQIEYGFPVSAGLGSSASLAAAIVRGVSAYLGAELGQGDLLELASSYERIVHGNPSGIDLQTVSGGGLVLFEGASRSVAERTHGVDLSLVVADSGERRSTGDLVSRVTEVKDSHPQVFSALMKINDTLIGTSWEALREGDLETLGRMFQVSQGLLHSLGVSTPLLDQAVHRAQDSGALGAKLTGAGGGGCIIAVPGNSVSRVETSLKEISPKCMVVHPDRRGVVVVGE